MHRVLIAHQSTIPHYRVRFYELLEERRPRGWSFEVAYDTRETERPTIYAEAVDHRTFKFPVLPARISSLRVAGKRVHWQHCWRAARKFDVVVTDTHFANLTYPVMALHQMTGRCARVLWGHPFDQNRTDDGWTSGIVRRLKLWNARAADAFFAYTPGHRGLLLKHGVAAERVTVLGNTVDTTRERELAARLAPRREEIRHELGLTGRRVLLYVGRLRPGKRVNDLIEAFACLAAAHPNQTLIIVGTGRAEERLQALADEHPRADIRFTGALTEPERLGQLFTAADLFVIPGEAGLAPVQAWCYGLPVIVCDDGTHGPEFEYCVPANSVVLPAGLPPIEFARRIDAESPRLMAAEFRAGIPATVAHLTLEAMADHFIEGINGVLQRRGRNAA